MSNIAIRVRNLSKRYTIGRARQRHDTLRDALSSTFQRSNGQRSNVQPFWALQDVSFEVQRGEVVGIIGRNGAGKSTLLKILSRITEPTQGRVEIFGRVGSLLEVGTGFHPELTGRENIYLNGAILGMRRAEIERKFDEIVDFSEIEQFLDTPVKRYSSGMYVRLAFAVAAHLEPEVLLVDEVLSVGDVAFQKKCLGKMGDVAKEGRTVIFVSHNMAAMTRLCSRGVLLREGRITLAGDVQDAVALYEEQMFNEARKGESPLEAHVLLQWPASQPLPDFAITRIEVLNSEGQPKAQIRTWDTVTFRIHYAAKRAVASGSAILQISTRPGVPLLRLSTQPDSTVPLPISIGDSYIDCTIDRLPLSAGEYIIGSGLAVPNKEWLCRDDGLAILKVLERDVYHSGLAPAATRSVMAVEHQWKTPKC